MKGREKIIRQLYFSEAREGKRKDKEGIAMSTTGSSQEVIHGRFAQSFFFCGARDWNSERGLYTDQVFGPGTVWNFQSLTIKLCKLENCLC